MPELRRGLAEVALYGDRCCCMVDALGVKGLAYVCDVKGDCVCVAMCGDLLRLLGLGYAC